MAAELAAIPGVKRVQMVRDARIVFRKTPVMIVADRRQQPRRNGARGRPSPATPTRCIARPPPGEGLMVSDNLAQLQQLKLGEVLEIPAPARRRSGCRSSASSSTIPISRARS